MPNNETAPTGRRVTTSEIDAMNLLAAMLMASGDVERNRAHSQAAQLVRALYADIKEIRRELLSAQARNIELRNEIEVARDAYEAACIVIEGSENHV